MILSILHILQYDIWYSRNIKVCEHPIFGFREKMVGKSPMSMPSTSSKEAKPDISKGKVLQFIIVAS